jgi:hypothetical protein
VATAPRICPEQLVQMYVPSPPEMTLHLCWIPALLEEAALGLQYPPLPQLVAIGLKCSQILDIAVDTLSTLGLTLLLYPSLSCS